MSSIAMLFACLLLGTLVARLATPPDNMAQGLNWWVLRVALPALVLQLVPQLDISFQLWFAIAAPWIVFFGAWLIFGTLGRWLEWSRGRTGAVIL
ncbi:MAG TPA: AEC family transporter, partial [Gammaproteobacteria bacterium]|nr:AEC family transporter [Gammaproteobacteria bacterium]